MRLPLSKTPGETNVLNHFMVCKQLDTLPNGAKYWRWRLRANMFKNQFPAGGVTAKKNWPAATVTTNQQYAGKSLGPQGPFEGPIKAR
jgi:hypothetical protein